MITDDSDHITISLDPLEYLTNEAESLFASTKRRDEILRTAQKLINGPRAEDYGDAYTNHQRIAAGWNVIVEAAFEKHGELLPAHVALMMDWVKTSRLAETIDHEDSWIDKAAYSALGAELAEKK